METLKIIVKSCGTCVFLESLYDDEKVGKDAMDYCILQQYLNDTKNTTKEYIIKCYDFSIKRVKQTPPKWCPLKNKNINIKLNF